MPAKPAPQALANLSKAERLRYYTDSFRNAITGIGTSRDKREGGHIKAENITKENAEELYRSSDLGGVLVEALPDEMTREGWVVNIEGEPELQEEVNAYIEGLGFAERLKEALYWSRQHGGAGILVGADDGAIDLGQPLDLDRISTIQFFTTLTRWELYPMYYYGDPLAPKYGHPSVFYLQQLFGLPQEIADVGGHMGGAFIPQSNSMMAMMLNYPEVTLKATAKGYEGRGVLSGKAGSLITTAQPLRTVHESRFLLFDGVPVTRTQRVRNNGWGDSVFTRVYEVLRDYDLSWGGVCNLLQDYAQGVYNIQGLADLMTGNDDGVVAARAQLLDLTRSLARAIVLDAGSKDVPPESFHREVTPLAGLADIMQQLALRLATAARMPVSLLLGQAPSGLNATGDSDIRWYYDRIKSKQNEQLTPVIKRLMKIVFATKDGPTKGKEPKNWSITHNSLWQLGNLEEAQRRFQIAQADNLYAQMGAVTPSEIGIERFGGDKFNSELHIDADAREALDLPNEELQAKAAGLSTAQGKNPDGSEKSEEQKNAESGIKPADDGGAKDNKSEEDKAAENTTPTDEKRKGKKPPKASL